MKLCKALISLTLASYMAALVPSEACTNVIITKGASADGSTLVSYAADSHSLYGELYFRKAADWKAGTPLKVYDWDSERYIGEISQVAHTYKTVGNMNEHQLIIAETTWGGRPELEDKTGGIDYGSLIYITLQRASTAREAIRIMTSLVEEYGYCSEGETFSIADKNEAWIMEMIGKGTLIKNRVNMRKGAVWVARRIPDGYICAHANQARITTFPLRDPENCLYSKDVISFAREMGYFEGDDDSEFSFRDAYNPLDFGGLRACEARAWSAFNILGNGWFTFEEDGRTVSYQSYDWLNYAMGYDKEKEMPLWIKPAKKVTVKALADVMRDHYEGTPMDMTQDIGAGGNSLPYRWRPMSFEVDGQKYLNERAIATQQTGFWFVGQARGAYPDVIGGIIWFGTDDAATSYLTPIYTNVEEVPYCYAQGNGDILTYSPTSSFWINNRIANACYKMYDQMAPFVRSRIDAYETEMVNTLAKVDAGAMALYKKAAQKAEKVNTRLNPLYDASFETGKVMSPVKKYLTEFCLYSAEKQFEAWVKMEETLLVKFIDGNVKAQNADGSFKHTKESVHMPEDLGWPGYNDMWKRAVAESHGDVLKSE